MEFVSTTRRFIRVFTGFAIIGVVIFVGYNSGEKPPVHSASSTQQPYTWTVTRVLDGDTVEVDAMFYPKELGHIRVRIEGIDTPESGGRAKCESERQRAKAAKQFAKDTLLGKKIIVDKVKTDKYGGRLVGEITVDGKPYRAMMIDTNMAKPYDGGTKDSWCKL